MGYIVNTPCGPLQGCAGSRPGTAAYKGIRYATAGRWEYPTRVTHWEGVYDATRYGACSYQRRAFCQETEQNFYYKEFRKGETYTYSEDCLFLNIFTPENAAEGGRLPVLVYIHGGGYTGGCGHEKHFNEPVWPTKGIIGVTLNYRLGPMGFVCLPQLQEEVGYTGNYGLYDQMTAIQWVKENIVAFGGDPDNITIMGQSAGATSVQLQCCSPLTDGLFSKAVMSSGGGMSKWMFGNKERSCKFWQTVMTRCGCQTLEQFRNLTPKALFDAWEQGLKEIKHSNSAVFPVTDGRFAVTDSQPKDIPYMAGSTSEDLAAPFLQVLTRRWIARRPKPGYTWLFDRQLPGDDKGAWHSADLWYWFGTLENCWRPMERKDYDLSEQMVSYLCNFVRTGNPNKGGELPAWIASGKSQRRVLILGEKPTAMERPRFLKMLVRSMKK